MNKGYKGENNSVTVDVEFREDFHFFPQKFHPKSETSPKEKVPPPGSLHGTLLYILNLLEYGYDCIVYPIIYLTQMNLMKKYCQKLVRVQRLLNFKDFMKLVMLPMQINTVVGKN